LRDVAVCVALLLLGCSRPPPRTDAPDATRDARVTVADAAPVVHVVTREESRRALPHPAATDPVWRAYIAEAIESCKKSATFLGRVMASPIDDASLSVLDAALRAPKSKGPPAEDVGVCLVDTLRHAGTQGDPLGLLRDMRVLPMIVARVGEKPGSVREDAVDSLRSEVPIDLIQAHGPALLASLAAYPDDTLFSVAAKAKLDGARPILEKFAARPELSGLEIVRIVRAALGDEASLRPYVEAFRAATTGDDKIKAARHLAAIGTKGALAPLCEDMRSPLMSGDPHSILSSVRAGLVEQLRYDYMEEPRLRPGNVLSDATYDAVESFCHDEFGTTWSTPRPPFFWSQGAPFFASPMRP